MLNVEVFSTSTQLFCIEDRVEKEEPP